MKVGKKTKEKVRISAYSPHQHQKLLQLRRLWALLAVEVFPPRVRMIFYAWLWTISAWVVSRHKNFLTSSNLFKKSKPKTEPVAFERLCCEGPKETAGKSKKNRGFSQKLSHCASRLHLTAYIQPLATRTHTRTYYTQRDLPARPLAT